MANNNRLHDFFMNSFSPFPTTPRRQPQAPRSQDRAIRQVPADPDPNPAPFFPMFAGVPGMSRYELPPFPRTYQPPRRQPGTTRKRFPRGRNLFEAQFSLGPPSPQTESEDETPPPSPRNSPEPPRSPSPPLKDYNPIARPNTPIDGLPKNWQQRVEDSINMGFGFAHSWIDTLKPRRREAEERICLPQIFRRKHRKTLIMLVAHKNVEESLFHKVEVTWKSEKKMKIALAAKFQLRIPFHRIRFSISDFAEVPLTQAMIDRFDAVEYFRLDTRKPDKWILYHIVNFRTQRCV